MVNSFAVLFCEVIIGVLIGTLIGAFILKISCAVYNFLAGVSHKPPGLPAVVAQSGDAPDTPNPAVGTDEAWAEYDRIAMSPGVPIPRFEWAMRIVFFAALVNTTGSFIVLRVVRLAWQASVRRPIGNLPIFLVASPLGMLVLGGICAAMLPTSFRKGLLVSLLYHLFVALLAAAAVGIALAFGLKYDWLG